MEQKDRKPPKKQLDTYIRYSALGFQMLGAIVITGYIGHRLDEYYNMDKPLITLGMLLLGVGSSIYMAVKGLSDK